MVPLETYLFLTWTAFLWSENSAESVLKRIEIKVGIKIVDVGQPNIILPLNTE